MTKPLNKKKNKNTALKCHTLTKNWVAYRIFFTPQFLALKKHRYEQKTTLVSLHSSICSATKSLQIFSRVSFPASKFTPIKLIKKDFSNTPLQVVKKIARQNNSNSLNCKKNQEKANNNSLS